MPGPKKQLNHLERYKYHCHKGKAKHRGIAFELTFDEWWDIWQQSGKWEERGCRKGGYVMSRHNDEGSYSINNVFIQTKYANDTEPQVIRKISNSKKGCIPWNKKELVGG
jgi:hypothetical protein